MRIRRIVAKNSREALRKVKQELGPEAVILRSRTLDRGHGSESEPMLEVTAAVELDSLAAGGDGNGPSTKNGPALRRWQRLEENLQELKEMLWSAEATSTLGVKVLYNSELHQLYSAYRELGMDGSIIRPILAEYYSHYRPKEGKDSMASPLQQALLQLLAKVKIRQQPKPNGKRQIWSFVGPTGVGKTTTMAKLAARAVLEQDARVALITVDQYRIGAIDQMRSYAQIMNLPLEIASNAMELGQAIAKHGDKEVLLIDTFGRCPSKPQDLTELIEIFRVPWKIEHQLVLSATTQYQDLVMAVTAFQPLGFTNYIISKLDETSDGAALVNFLLSRPRPLSYFTAGQRVPEDIEPASKKRLATLLLQRRQAMTGRPNHGTRMRIRKEARG